MKIWFSISHKKFDIWETMSTLAVFEHKAFTNSLFSNDVASPAFKVSPTAVFVSLCGFQKNV